MKINAALGAGTAITPGSVDANPQFQPARRSESRLPRKSSLLRGVLLAAAVLSTGVAVADFTIPIDPVKNCLDTATGSFPFGSFATRPPVPRTNFTWPLWVGSYVVELRDNSMRCFDGNLTGIHSDTCNINTVLLRVVGSFQAGWGLSVTTGHPVLLDALAVSQLSAFIIDTPCADNTGSATLYIRGRL